MKNLLTDIYLSSHCPEDKREEISKKLAELCSAGIDTGKITDLELLKDELEMGYVLPVNTVIGKKAGSKILVVEPHGDDGVLSAGGTLLQMAEKGAEISSLCIFSAGGEIEPIRKRENELVWKDIFKGRAQFAGFADGPYREGGSAETGPDIMLLYNVRKAIKRKIREEKPDMVIGPLGIGGHIDHGIVNRALLSIYKEDKQPIFWFYEDFPYANNERYFYIKALHNAMKEVRLLPVYFDITDKIEDKISLFMVYLSQHSKTRSQIRETLLRYGEAIGLEGIAMNREMKEGNYYERLWNIE